MAKNNVNPGRSGRDSRGQSLCELAAGLMVAVPVLLLLIDCAVIAMGISANDSACRDAARAAASGRPAVMLAGTRNVSNGQEPKKRARQVIVRIYRLGLPVKVLDDGLSVKESLQNPVPAAPTGGSVNGSVVVQSTVDVYPPFLIGAVCSKVSFKSRHTFPYTYVEPMQVAAASGGP